MEPAPQPSATDGPIWSQLARRRDLLRIGSLGLAAAALPAVAAQSGEASAAGPDAPETAESVLFLFMAGGVTHIDSFDPKPGAPAEIRGTLGAIDTVLPGVRFCEALPELARVADRLALVRSYSHDSNDHLLSQVYSLSGRKVNGQQLFSEPNIGSLVSHLHGPRAGLPGYIAVPGITRPGPPPHNLFVGGWLGQQYAPFAVGGQPEQPDFAVAVQRHASIPDSAPEDLRPADLEFLPGLNRVRLERRAELRSALESACRIAERRLDDAIDQQYRSALNLLSSSQVRSAFDLEQEPVALRDRYGRTKLGQRCLMARRLIEAGARFVMVDYGYDPDYGNLWDNHRVPVQRQPHICEIVKKPYHLAGMDRAFAALLTDLESRGLLHSTLVVFMTEFGRTPKINAHGGRDHWGAAGSIFFAGGGTRAGQVIGGTDRQAAFPTSRGFTPADVAATIYRALGIDAESRVYDLQRRPMPVLPSGEPIPVC
jgi:hypothetical protein